MRVVPHKDEASFRALADDLAMNPGRCWVIGDSLRSDIAPAVRAGFRAVHFDSHNWAAHERTGHVLPQGAHVVSSLADALGIIQASWGEPLRSA